MNHDEQVYRELEAVRRSGKVNMYDSQGVYEIAVALGYDALVSVMDESRRGSRFPKWHQVLKAFGEWLGREREKE